MTLLSTGDMDLYEYIAGIGTWEWLGGGLTTHPCQSQAQEALHARCRALEALGLIIGEDNGLWWSWRASDIEWLH